MQMSDFPNAPHGWSIEDTEQKAEKMGISLTDQHWEIVQSLQDYFARNEKANRRELTDALEERFHSVGGLKYLYKLLPGGPVAQGCELAGICQPAGTVDESFGSVV